MPSEENTKKRKIPNQRKGESKKGKENSQLKEGEKAKKKKKENPRSKIGRKQKKHVERSLDQTISEQYRIVTKKTKKKETTT